MNFFEHQARARRRTWVLVALFVLALICIVVLVDLAALAFFGASHSDRYVQDARLSVPEGLYATYVAPNASLLFWVSVVTAGGIALASQVRILTLRGGGGTVARGLGGTLVAADTTDPLRRRLHNVVEEMAIAAGVPVPEIYVLDREPGINAFAAGYTPADAAVAVTQGALEALNRAELQGVIAHEFGHILNGDMRLNIRLMGILFGILVLGLIGRVLLGSGQRTSSQRDNRGMVAIGVALVAIGYVGLLCGRLIKASVARQREYLADASAVQFTRQPEGLAGALKKIGATRTGSLLQTNAEEVSHMLFAKGTAGRFLATHPPLESRIRALQPDFDPREFNEIATRLQRQTREPAQKAPAPRATDALAFDPERLIEQMGQPGLGQILAAGLLAESIPSVLERAAHSSAWAMATVCYVLVDTDPAIGERQLLMVTETLGRETGEQLETLLAEVPRLDPALRLPLLEIAFPALRQRPEQSLTALLGLIERLVHADGRVELFEYAIAKLLSRQIEDVLNPAQGGPGGNAPLSQHSEQAVDLLAILAYHGQHTPQSAQSALIAGVKHLSLEPFASNAVKNRLLESQWLQQGWSERLDTALATLVQVRLADKQRLLAAMAATVLADGQVSVVERELLRAICAALRMPLPVFEQAAVGR